MRLRANACGLLPFAVLAFAAAPAFAQSCSGEIERLARQYDIGTEAPRSGSAESPPSGGDPGVSTPERSGKTGGVLTPPDVHAPMSVHPPAGDPDAGPPAPSVAPRPPGNATALTEAQRSRMASLLDAARAAARQGRYAQCLEDLRAAEAVPGVPGSSPRQ